MPRKIRGVEYSPQFLKHFSRLPANVIEKAREREFIFRMDVFDPRLRTHKLHGRDKDAWAFWIDFTYRIKFVFLNEEEVLFLDAGTHDMYR